VNRALVLLLAVIGGAAGALAIMMGFTAALMGMLWIFVFGDDPWPAWVEPVLNTAIPIVGLFLWLYVGWLIWRRLVALRPEG
jgi:apolipoprotein N-acyltransferase